jgi:hypothetical protein
VVRDEIVEEAVRRVRDRLAEPLRLETLSIEGMMEAGLGLALCPEASQILEALLSGRRVVIPASGLAARNVGDRCPAAVQKLLKAGEQRIIALGVEISEKTPETTPGHRPLVTLSRAEELRRQGLPLPPNALITPSAADYWKEQEGL